MKHFFVYPPPPPFFYLFFFCFHHRVGCTSPLKYQSSSCEHSRCHLRGAVYASCKCWSYCLCFVFRLSESPFSELSYDVCVCVCVCLCLCLCLCVCVCLCLCVCVCVRTKPRLMPSSYIFKLNRRPHPPTRLRPPMKRNLAIMFPNMNVRIMVVYWFYFTLLYTCCFLLYFLISIILVYGGFI
jgi:hypothetical protein